MGEVWVNDVNLAKEKVKSYSEQETLLEARISDIKGGNDRGSKSLHAEEETNIREKAQVEIDILNLQNQIDSDECKMKDAEKKSKEEENAIDAQLKKKYLNDFAQCAHRACAVEKAVRCSWAEQLDEIKDLTEYLVEAETFGEQKRLMWQLRKNLNAQTIPVLAFVKEARPPTTLAPGPNKVHVLANGGTANPAIEVN